MVELDIQNERDRGPTQTGQREGERGARKKKEQDRQKSKRGSRVRETEE